MNKSHIETTIINKHYVVTDHDVELLAASHLACNDATKRADTSYLRILVQALQAQFDGTKHRRKPSKMDLENHSKYLAETHTRLYAFVLKGVTTPDCADSDILEPDERRARAAIRNSRGAFARSNASTIQGFIKAGGDVRSLDVATVNKSQLMTYRNAAMASDNPRSDFILSALKRIERQAIAWAKDDPDEVRNTIEDCMGRLQKILDELGNEGAPANGHTATHVEGAQTQVGVESQVFQRGRGAKFRPRTAAA